MAEAFKVGDLVQLKSGGPAMTVEAVLLGGALRCQWFSPRSKLNKGVFEPNLLVRGEPGKKRPQK